jgi:branched-chain amino acid transport system permease protein
LSERLRILALAVVAVIAACAIPSHSFLSTGVFAGISAIVALGLCLLLGYSGQLSIGQTAFYGIGAYTVAVGTTLGHLDPWIALVLAIVIGAGAGFLVGLVLSGLDRHVMGLATLGLGVAAFVVFNESPITGGASGISEIPRLQAFGLSFGSDSVAFGATWVAVAFVMLLSTNVLRARFGRTLTAIGDSAEAARACGVSVSLERAKVFALSGAFGGLAGALYAFYTAFVNPSPFALAANIAIVSIVMIGGVTSLWGSVVGALFVTILPQLFGSVFGASNVSGIQILVYGSCIIAVTLFLPDGIVPSLAARLRSPRGLSVRKEVLGESVTDQPGHQTV